MDPVPETWATIGGLCLVGVDWLTIAISDVGNLVTAAAYLLGIPMMGLGIWSLFQRHEPLFFWLVISFVASCGLGHLLDFAITHNANPHLVMALVLQRVMTAVISWACILQGFFVVQRRGVLITFGRAA